jgi:hypothetical protein
MRRFRFNELSFEAPSDWMDLSIVTLAGTDSSRFQPNLVITREDAPAGSLKDFAKRQLPEIKKQVKSHKLVAEREEAIAGREGYVLEHQMMTPERHVVRQLQYFVRSGSDVVVMSLTCAEPELASRAPMLAKIAESLKIEA